MRNKIIPFIIALFFSATIYAQPDTLKAKPRVSYFNQFMAGGLVWEKMRWQHIDDFNYAWGKIQKSSVGLGLGYDSYLDWRTLPVFTDISYDLEPPLRTTHCSFN